MSLKVGDIVRYVGKNPLNRPNIYGWVGKCVSPSVNGWFVDPPLPGGVVEKEGSRYEGSPVVRGSLKKIDKPGDDAHDETLEWLPVPSKQKETA